MYLCVCMCVFLGLYVQNQAMCEWTVFYFFPYDMNIFLADLLWLASSEWCWEESRQHSALRLAPDLGGSVGFCFWDFSLEDSEHSFLSWMSWLLLLEALWELVGWSTDPPTCLCAAAASWKFLWLNPCPVFPPLAMPSSGYCDRVTVTKNKLKIKHLTSSVPFNL